LNSQYVGGYTYHIFLLMLPCGRVYHYYYHRYNIVGGYLLPFLGLLLHLLEFFTSSVQTTETTEQTTMSYIIKQ